MGRDGFWGREIIISRANRPGMGFPTGPLCQREFWVETGFSTKKGTKVSSRPSAICL